ncbi:MAG: sigma-70 family RNA polymerase sigma factor [Nannocystaceae bacterium]|nr:sigma-70 family RNA polymerase sigma factor [Nannocystaceae bacterium]
MSSDAELFDRWADGDRAAGNQLIRRHFDAVYKFFRNKVSSEAEDLIQRTFLACTEARARYRRESPFRAFLLGLARIELLNHYRRQGRPGAQIDASVTAVHDLRTSPTGLLVQFEEQRILLDALRRIPIDSQIVLELSYWEGMNSTALGEVLQIPAPTVRSRLRRAKALLREQVLAIAPQEAVGDSVLTNLDAWASSLRKVTDKKVTDKA